MATTDYIPPWERGGKKPVQEDRPRSKAHPERPLHKNAPHNPVPGRTNKKTSPVNIEKRNKQAEALLLRQSGLSFPKIAEKLEISQRYAYKLVSTAIKEITREPAEDVLILETERLDALLTAAYDRAIQNGGSYDINSCLKIMERRAKLLGLDGAIKVEDVTQVESPLAKLKQIFGVSAAVQDATK